MDKNLFGNKVHSISVFLLSPRMTRMSVLFHGTVALLATLDIICQLFLTVDGPHKHPKDEASASKFSELPTALMFLQLRIALNALLFAVLLMQIIAIIDMWLTTKRPSLHISVFIEALSIISFILTECFYSTTIVYNNIYYSTEQDILAILQMGKILWILVFAKVLPEVQALLLTFRSSRRALMVPLSMLTITNTTIATILYFTEPCYNVDTCPWNSLYSSWFFGIVTMARVGYGDQNSHHFYTRIFVVIAMLLGGIFFSMPLAIITEKYNSAYEMCKTLNEDDEKSVTSQNQSKSKSNLASLVGVCQEL